jgi:nitrate reductase NapE component
MSLNEVEMNTLIANVATIMADNKQILKQTTETNGRVTDLEQWKNKAIGAIIALSFVSGTGLVAWIFQLVKAN